MTALRVRLAAALLALVAAASVGGAQSAAANPWAAFYGCWVSGESIAANPPVTCVKPVADEARTSEHLTIVAGEIVRRTRLVADGRPHTLDGDGCTGWERAEFSPDGARVYFRGEISCGARGTQSTSGLMSITSTGEWLDIGVIRTGAQESVRAQRLQAHSAVVLPEAVRAEFERLALSATSARAAATRSVTVSEIAEAAVHVDGAVAELWLLESVRGAERPLRVRRAELERLEAAGAPERVMNAAVAVANPAHFRVDLSVGGLGAITQLAATGGSPAGVRPGCEGNAWNDSWYLPAWSMTDMMFGGTWPLAWASMPAGPGCLPVGYFARYGSMGFSRWGHYPGFFPGYGYPVTVVVTPGPPPLGSQPSRGRVVQGRGYSSGRSGEAAAPSSVRPSSGGSTSGGTRSTGSSSSGSGGRTAKPRSP